MHGHVGQANAAVPGCGHDGVEHDVVNVLPRGVAVQVMKLGNRGESRVQHLAVGLSRNRGQRFGADAAGQFVHALPPGPEIITALRRALLGVSGEGPLKRVAVSVAQARNDAAELLFGKVRVRLDRGDTPAFDIEAYVVVPAVG